MGDVRAVLAIPDLRRLELGWGCSVLGELAGTIVLAVYAFDQGGAALVGLYGILRTIPAGPIAPLVMGLSDRMPRELLLRLAMAVRTLLLGGAGLAAAVDAPAPVVIALGAASSMLAITYRPLLIAILPWLVRSPAELGAVNVLAATMENLGSLAGPVVAALLLANGPAWLAMGAAAGFLAAATFLVWPIHLDQQQSGRNRGAASLLLDSFRGLADIARVAPPAGLAVLLFAQTFVRGALTVLLVVLAIDVLHAGESAVGWLYAAMGVGGLAGGVVAAAVVPANWLGRAFIIGLFLWGLPLALVAPAPGLVACLAALAVVGVGNAIQDVADGTLAPRLFSPAVLGRVLGGEELIVFVGTGIGAAAAAPMIAIMGPRGTLAVLGLGLIILTAAYAFRFLQIDRALPKAVERADLLRGLPIFATLSLAVADLLATRLSPREYAAQTVVMREGDRGDDYQVIVEGSAVVTVRGIARRILRAGDGFGEIALLRDIPRTATITASERLRTLALQREDFLAAVACHPATAATAEDIIGQTLKADPPATDQLD